MALSNQDILAAQKIRRLIDDAVNVVVTCHMAPDGDALGSSLALWEILRRRGKKATVVTPDMAPRSLAFLPGVKNIITASNRADLAARLIAEADLIVCLDFNALMRVDRLADILRNAGASKVLVDHHLGPEDFADVMVSQPEKSSTCLLLYQLLLAAGLGDDINREAAECLVTGMLTDTGGLAYNANDPELYSALADLLARGVDKDRIMKLVFDNDSESRVRICGYAVYHNMLLLPSHRAAVITLSREELDDFAYQKGDTESLVNRPLSMPDTVCSIFLREDSKDYVKVSMRSKGAYPVNLICEEHFGGGGHLNAAGGEYRGDIGHALDAVLKALPRYDSYLPENIK